MRLGVLLALAAAAALVGAEGAKAALITPEDVAGLDLWLRADVGVTTTGGAVSLWADQSGNNRDASQAAALRQPSHVLNERYGLPVLRFDGANSPNDDHLNLATATTAQTIFVVNRVNTGAKFLAGVIGLDSGDKGIRRISATEWRHPGDGNDFTNPAGSRFFVNGRATNVVAENAWHVAAGVRSGSTATYNSLGGYYGGREFGGDVAEVVVYNRELSSAERDRVGAYLAAKWGTDYTLGISDLNLWLRADKDVTAPGGSVSLWADQSVNNRNAVQATAARQPTHVAAAVNGLPAVRFDGANSPDDDHLNFTSNATAQTIFVVNRVNTGAKSLAGIIGLDGGDKGIRRISATEWRHPGDGNDFTNPAGSRFFVNGQATNVVAENTWHVVSAVRSGSTATYNSLGGYYGGREFGGDVAEVLVFSRPLNDAERIVTENYLGAKYGIALAANDFYAGDQPAYGNYDRDVIGIGSMSGGVHSAHGAAGLYLFENNGSLDLGGEFVLAGHRVETNSWVTADLPPIASLRSDRVWYIESTGGVDVELTFNLAAAGLPEINSPWPFGLLYSPTSDPYDFRALSVTTTAVGGLVSFDVPAAMLLNGYYTLGVVPEPASAALLGLGIGLLWVFRRRRG